jgi:hypothetical protein
LIICSIKKKVESTLNFSIRLLNSTKISLNNYLMKILLFVLF